MRQTERSKSRAGDNQRCVLRSTAMLSWRRDAVAVDGDEGLLMSAAFARFYIR